MNQKANIEKIVEALTNSQPAKSGLLMSPAALKGGLFELGLKYVEGSPNIIKSTKDLGDQIKSNRRQRDLSQQELADLAGVGRRFLSELENGKPSLEFGKVITVANALGIDLFAKQR